MTSNAAIRIKPPSADETFRLLESKIISGEYQQGECLPSERKLAEEYGISRPGIREVLQRLEERGLIEVRPGLGSYVMELMPTRGSATLEHLVLRGDVTAREVIVARSMLEGEAAAIAAQARTGADIDRMQRLLAAFDEATDIRLAAELDIAFHESIVLAAANPVLQVMFGAIRDMTQAMILRSLTDRVARHVGAPVHHNVLEAIIAQDSERARSQMRHHLDIALEIYENDIDLPLASVLQLRADRQPEIAALLRGASLALPRSAPAEASVGE
jgi:GntR family transcriptional repressor for pyruvate dehydrogenase complex